MKPARHLHLVPQTPPTARFDAETLGSRLLSLAAGTILDVAPFDAPDVAAAADFPAVGIWYDPASWTDQVARQTASRLAYHGVIALDLEPVMIGASNDHGEAMIAAALTVGARHVLVASREADDGRVADRLAALAEHTAGTPLRLVLEFLPALGVRTLAQTVSIVERVGHPCLGVLIDALHLARTGESIDDVRSVDPQLMPYLQLCDAPAALENTSVTGLLVEALRGRLLPGDGELPLHDLLDAVPDAAISFEIRSDALRELYPDPVERASAVLRSVGRG